MELTTLTDKQINMYARHKLAEIRPKLAGWIVTEVIGDHYMLQVTAERPDGTRSMHNVKIGPLPLIDKMVTGVAAKTIKDMWPRLAGTASLPDGKMRIAYIYADASAGTIIVDAPGQDGEQPAGEATNEN